MTSAGDDPHHEGPPLVHTFSISCRQRFGAAVGKIPLDVGVVCPNRRHGGCIYCRPAAFTATSLAAGGDVAAQLRRGREQLRGRFSSYFAYLQQETCTALDASRLLPLLDSLLQADACRGLILSTRPDFLPEALLADLHSLVQGHGKECLVELGLQSVHQRSLKLLNRNHDYAAFTDAVGRIREFPALRAGAHLLLGIPGESAEEMRVSVASVCALGIDDLKIHHLQVLRDTTLAQWWRQGRVATFTCEGYLELLLTLLPLIPARVVIHRLWAEAHPADLLAPRWHLHAAALSGELRRRLALAGLRQGCALPEAAICGGTVEAAWQGPRSMLP